VLTISFFFSGISVTNVVIMKALPVRPLFTLLDPLLVNLINPSQFADTILLSLSV
jgi:hypothetical protein